MRSPRPTTSAARNIIAEYAFGLAQTFSGFYDQCHFLSEQ